MLHDVAIDESELRPLLDQLHEQVSQWEDAHVDSTVDDAITIEAVCEATGRSANDVYEALLAIRARDYQAELTRRLNELEEPLHRVERAAPKAPNDPLSHLPITKRARVFSNLLDEVQQRNKPIVIRKKSAKDQEFENKQHHTIAMATLVFIAILILLIVGRFLFGG